VQRAVKLLSVSAKVNTLSFEGRILVRAEEDSVKFLSNNGKTGVSYVVPAKVITPGETSVVYSKIKSFLMTFQPWDGETGAEEFHFIMENGKMNIKTSVKHLNGQIAKSNLKVDTIRSDNIPKIEAVEEPNMILNSSIIKTAVDKVLYAVNPKDTQTNYAQCICMIFTEDHVSFVATDGRVLCEYKVNNDCSLKEGAYLLTHEFIMGLRRIIVDDVQLFWQIDKRIAKVDFDNIIFQGYIQGINLKSEYPDYKKQFTLFDSSVELERDMLVNGLSSFVDILDGEDFNRVSFEIKDKKLSIRTDVSNFEVEDTNLPEDLSVIVDVNGKDMLNTLYSMSDEDVAIKFIDETKGLVFDSIGFEKQKAYVTNLMRR
jgi:DNA polymerase III sliding clamp (beta) subunit (PCNA family)